MNLSEKLFLLIQGKYDETASLSRTALLGLSSRINADLVLYLSDHPEKCIHDKSGRIVPVILIEEGDPISRHEDGLWYVLNGDVAFPSREKALAEYRCRFQDGYQNRGWGRGTQDFAVRVRNDAPDAPVVFLASEASKLSASLSTATVSFGFGLSANEGDGCGYFLEDDFYLGLLPQIKCESGKRWPIDYASLFKPIYDECTSPDQAWSLLKQLNAAANESDAIDVPIFEAIVGLPNSKKDRVSQRDLQAQITLMSGMAEMLSSAERDAFFTRLQEEFPSDLQTVQLFRTHVLAEEAKASIDGTIYAVYAGSARCENLTPPAAEPWWEKFTIDVLERVLPGQKSSLEVEVTGQLIGDFASRKIPIVANNALEFAFKSTSPDAQVSVFRAKTPLASELSLSDGFSYQAEGKDSKPFKLVFEAKTSGLARPSRALHDVIMLDKSDSGCFATIEEGLHLKKATPFSPSRKNAKHSFVSRIVALKETNALVQLFTGSEFVLDEDSVEVRYEGEGDPRKLYADRYNRYYGMRCDLLDGAEIHFSGKSKKKKCSYSVEIRVEQKETESLPTVFDLLVDCHLRNANINSPVSFNSGTISSRISQEHLTAVLESSELVGYPLLIADDIAQFHNNGWLNSFEKATNKVFQTVDPRPDAETWKQKCRTPEAQNFFSARKRLFQLLHEHADFGGGVVEEFDLYKISKEENKEIKTQLSNFLQAYGEWLSSDYETAIVVDTIWAFLSDGNSLPEKPDVIFLLPQHPMRLYWQFQAQRHMYELLSVGQQSNVVASFDSHSNPDVLYVPLLNSTTGRAISHAFFAIPTSSDYWGVYHSYSPILASETLEKSPFFQNWGFEITSVKRTMSAGEVESAINATQSVCIAKDALNIRYVGKNMGGNSARMLLRQGLEFLVGKNNSGPTFGPRVISIVGSRTPAGPDSVTEAEIMNAREQSDGRLQWYAETGNGRHVHKIDVTIASLGAANISPYLMEDEPSFGVVSGGGLLRYRNRCRGVGTASEIVESRIIRVAPDAAADEEDNVYLGVLEKLEGVQWLNQSASGHVRFNADIVGAGIMRPNDDSSHYYAISSSDVDQACFESMNGNKGVYLWEYRLPMPGAHAGGTDGFYLLAKENPTMIQAVSEAVKSLNAAGVDDDGIREMLFSSAKRGIPTVKNLASGGKNALGEVGVLVTLNLLQGRLDDASKGLLPAHVEINGFDFYNILVPMDVFRERFETLAKEILKEKSPARPDVICFSIKCKSTPQGLQPLVMRLSGIEIKTRTDRMSESSKEEALKQSDVFRRLYAEHASSIPRLLNWERLDFLVGMMTFGFRVYESIPELLKPLVALYPKVVASLFESEGFLEVNPLPRLSVIHDIPESRLSMEESGVFQTIEVSKKDGYLIAIGKDVSQEILPIGAWGLLPEGQGGLSVGDMAKAEEAVAPVEPPQTPLQEPTSPIPVSVPIQPVQPTVSESSHDGAPPATVTTVKDSENTEEKYADILHAIKDAFEDFGIETTRVANPIETPNFVLIDYKGTPSCTKARIAQKREEFLSTYGIDLHQIEPRKGVVRLVLKREKRAILQMEKVWSDFQYNADSARDKGLLIAIEEATGEPVYLNPAKESSPHTLVAGATGSGKSVLLLNMLHCLKDCFVPDEVTVIIMDPKQVDFLDFADVPNFTIISDQGQAISKFQDLVREMEDRYALFRQYRVKKLSQLNNLPDAPKLPTIWCFHDEFPDWFMDENYQRNVGAEISKLSAKARAAGIFLVFAAQRPEASVMPPFMRSNFGLRLVLKVADKGTSNIALGDANAFGQANELLGKGHMIAVLSEKTVYCQVPNVEN